MPDAQVADSDAPAVADPAGFERVDVALLVIINPELDSVRKALDLDQYSDRRHHGGGIHWITSVSSAVHPERTVKIAVYVQGQAGLHAASSLAGKVLDRHKPLLVLMTGISAGLRGSLAIGDVVGALGVADQSTVAALPHGNIGPRTWVERRPYVVSQMCAASTVPTKKWHELFGQLYRAPPPSPATGLLSYGMLEGIRPWVSKRLPKGGYPGVVSDKMRSLAQHLFGEFVTDSVATKPKFKEAVINSDNVLLRDGTGLAEARERHHQQILVGEMEAAGLLQACDGRSPSTPWWVIRGVSDFGDPIKGDGYHYYASCAAASYAAMWIRYVLDLEALDSGLGGRYSRPPSGSPPSLPSGEPPKLAIEILDPSTTYITVAGRDVGISPSGPIMNFPMFCIRIRVRCDSAGDNAVNCKIRVRFGDEEASLWDRPPQDIYRGDYRDTEIAKLGGTETRRVLYLGAQTFTLSAGQLANIHIQVMSENGALAEADYMLPASPTFVIDRSSVSPDREITLREAELLSSLFSGLDGFRRETLEAITSSDLARIRGARAGGDSVAEEFSSSRVQIPLQVDPQGFLDVFNGLYQCLIDASAENYGSQPAPENTAFSLYQRTVLPLFEQLTAEWRRLIDSTRSSDQ